MMIYCGYKKEACNLFFKLSDEELLEFKKGLEHELKSRKLLNNGANTGKVQSKNTTHTEAKGVLEKVIR